MMENWQELTALCETCGCSVRYAEPLRNHTTFRIGGNCGAFVSINSIETLRRVLALCREKQYPYLVLGNGSNVRAVNCFVNPAQPWRELENMRWKNP